MKRVVQLILKLRAYLNGVLLRTQSDIIRIYDCAKTRQKMAVVRVRGQQTMEKYLTDFLNDYQLLELLDKKTIKALAFAAGIDMMKPSLFVAAYKACEQPDNYVFEIRSRRHEEVMEKTLLEVSRDKNMLAQFGALDANLVGYLAGVKVTVEEYECGVRKMS